MTGPSEADADLQRWARRQFGLGETAPADRATLLRRLPEEAFAPPPGVDYAARVLAGTGDAAESDPGWREAQRDLEHECRAEVEALARDFFALAHGPRRRRWEELRPRAAAFPAVLARLDALQPGLSLDPAGLDGPAGKYARMVCELFVLAPADRAARRRQLLEELDREKGSWAARALQRSAPQLAALEPVFLGVFLNHTWHQQQAEQARNTRVAKPAAASGSGGSGWILWIILVVVGAIARMGSNSSGPRNPPREEFHVPNGAWQPGPNQFKGWQNDLNDKHLKDLIEGMKLKKWQVKDGKLIRGDGVVPPAPRPPPGGPRWQRRPDVEPRPKVEAGEKR